MNMSWTFFKPNSVRIALTVILGLCASIVQMGFEWTSKRNWIVERGFPIPFMVINEYVHGGYCPYNNICLAVNIKHFYPIILFLDFVVWFLAACVIVSVYEKVKMQRGKGESAL